MPPDRMPAGAYLTGLLMLGLLCWVVWLVASYPNDPSKRIVADKCTAISQPEQKATEDQIRSGKRAASEQEQVSANAPDSANEDPGEKIKIDREIAEYTCQLAAFTRLLFYATGILGLIGLVQSVVLYRSVKVADRAATEARDAINAAKTSADASLRSASVAERTLFIANRPWLSVEP